MATFLHVLLIIAIVLVCLFVLSFIVYFFNLEYGNISSCTFDYRNCACMFICSEFYCLFFQS